VSDLGRYGVYLALFAEIGVVLGVAIVAGVLGGWWLDRQLHTLPAFVLIGALGGLASGGVAVARIIARFLARFE
jgi:F0F1-type ATP synthase assembly protein I